MYPRIPSEAVEDPLLSAQHTLETADLHDYVSGTSIFLSLSLSSLSISLSKKQSPSIEANRSSAGQEIPRISRNPKVHYHIHVCAPPVPILSQLDPVHTPHPSSLRSILILSSHLRLVLPSGSFLRFPHQNPV